MKRVFLILSLVVLISCSKEKGELRRAMIAAGPNRGEIEKVLDHYGSEPEKLRAAEYLISSMTYHTSYCGALEEFRSMIDSLAPKMKTAGLYNKYMSEISDSLKGKIKQTRDIRAISSEYLISNIDEAFNLWKNGRWANHLSLDEFCEYILPYKVEEDQPLEDWRSIYRNLYCGEESIINDAIDEYKAEPTVALQTIRKKAIGNVLIYTDSLESTRLYDLSVLKDVPYGNCISVCDMGLLLYRSKGIPVAADYVPGWADRAGRHYWMSVYTRRCKSLPVDAFSTVNPEDKFRYRRIPKVYRRTYKPDEELLHRVRIGYPVPLDIFFKDVTEEYIKCEDVTVDITNHVAGSNVYVAIFDNQRWVPAAYGKRRLFGKVCFEKLGRNALYLPVAVRRTGEQIPLGQPFYINIDGTVETISGDAEGQLFDIFVTRKYPKYWMMGYVFAKTRGGVVQGSNSWNFSEAETVAEVHDNVDWTGYLPIASSTAYRYFRFCAPAGARADIGELKFYNGDEELNPGKVILPDAGFRPVVDGRPVKPSNIIDDDALTFLEVDDADGLWVGVDFGEPVNVSGIYYSMRSDGNNLYPGYEYALKRWDDGWQVLEEFVASKEGGRMFKNLQSGSLYLVTCSTTGTQSRPFVVKDGSVVWY